MSRARRRGLATHVLARHARGIAPSPAGEPAPKIFTELASAERLLGPRVAQKSSDAAREHIDDRPSAVTL